MSAKISAPPSIPFATAIVADLTRDIAKTRKHLRDLAAKLRAEARHG